MFAKRYRVAILGIAVVVVSIIATNVISGVLVEANGAHARDHLATAQGAIPLVVLLAVALWAMPRRGRLVTALIWIAALAIAVGSVLVAAGNLQVIHAINGASWTDEQAARLGSLRPGFDAGHDLAALGETVTRFAAILFALVVTFAARAVGYIAGIASAVLTFIFPSQINPAAGLPVVAIALLVRKSRKSAHT
jgi:hypothetical protein